MKIFIDSAEITEIEAAAKTGLIDGVTTNPSLVAKSGQKFEDLIKRICEVVDGPISAEVTSLEAEGMLQEAEPLAAIHPNVTIKVPLTHDGLIACKSLTSRGVKVNVTLCFSPLQALLAAKAGATFVSPFVGRLDDIGQTGMSLISEIQDIYRQYAFETEILTASVRHVEHVLEAARLGSDVATIPYSVFTKLIKHPLTDSGIERFLKDWEGAKK